MSLKGSIGQELTWSGPLSTGQPACHQDLESSAKAAWPYAQLCARVYLNDPDAAHHLVDHAVQNVAGYIARHPNSTSEKLTSRIKSVIRRRAKHLAAGKIREVSFGSAVDLEQVYATEPSTEQMVYARELLARLSPFAQSIIKWRWVGYTWREIARELDLDHTVVRRAYFREMQTLLRSLSQAGDLSRCD